MSILNKKINKTRTILLLTVQKELESKLKKNEEMNINCVSIKDLNEKYNINKIEITIKGEEIVNDNFISPNLNITFLDNLHVKSKINSDENLIDISTEHEERKVIQQHLKKKQLHKGKSQNNNNNVIILHHLIAQNEDDKLQINSIRYLKKYAKNFINSNLKKKLNVFSSPNKVLKSSNINKLHNIDLIDQTKKKNLKQKHKNTNIHFCEENKKSKKKEVFIKHSNTLKNNKKINSSSISNDSKKTKKFTRQFKKHFSLKSEKSKKLKEKISKLNLKIKNQKEESQNNNDSILNIFDFDKTIDNEVKKIYNVQIEKPLIQLHKCVMTKKCIKNK